MSEHNSRPRENLIRAVMPAVEYRAGEGDDDRPILFGHFSRANEWAEINSRLEGHFLERFAPGAWKKTIKEQRDRLRVLFQHGQDPDIGDKPIAELMDVREDDEGGYYEARLFDGLPQLVVEGLRAGQYGASHRFSVVRDREEKFPARSEHNPDGIPERTIVEAKLREFGPVTWPAYAGATAGVRSMTDDILLSWIRSNPEGAREMFDRALSLQDLAPTPPAQEPAPVEAQQDAPSESDAETPDVAAHLTDERREDKPTSRRPIYGTRRKETSKPWLLGPSKSTKRS